MKTKTFAWLSSAAVIAGILAGCGVNNVAGNGITALTSSTSRLYVDATGAKRRFGLILRHHAHVPSFNWGGSAGNLPSSVDLRTTGKISPVYDQGQLGSCTAFAMGKGLRETLTNMAGAKPTPVSALYLYYKERQIEGTVGQDSGANMETGMKVLQNSGDCLDSTMPYNIAKFTQKPSAKAESEAANLKIDGYTQLPDLNGLKAQLASGQPAVFGFTVYQSFMNIGSNGVMPMPKAGEQVIGGHAVFVVGYDDNKQSLIVRNSWGTSWGDNGYFYMPYAYFTSDNVDGIFGGKAHNF